LIFREEKVSYEILNNNVTYFAQKKKESRTVSLAFAVKVGSSVEDDANNGISHFLEHILFKGTLTRNAYNIKEPIERVGGNLNAYTGRVSTVFFAKVPDTYAEEAFNILYDLISNPMMMKDDIELEKTVVTEEIAFSKDDPFDQIYDNTVEKLWTNSFGKNILGTKENVNKFEQKSLMDFFRNYYTSNRLVFGMTGNVNDEFIKKTKEKISGYNKKSEDIHVGSPEIIKSPVYLINKKKDLQQAHVLFSVEAPGRKNQKNFEAFKLFNIIFGSGMSSIIFHNIREKLGMVYNIDSEFISYKEAGTFFISALTNPKNLKKVRNKLHSEINNLIKNGITKEQFNYGKERLKGKLLISTEGTFPTLSRIIDDIIINERLIQIEHILKFIDEIKIDDVNEILIDTLKESWNVTYLLPEQTKIDKIEPFEF